MHGPVVGVDVSPLAPPFRSKGDPPHNWQWILNHPRAPRVWSGDGQRRSYFWNGLPRGWVTFCILSVSISRNAKTSNAKSLSLVVPRPDRAPVRSQCGFDLFPWENRYSRVGLERRNFSVVVVVKREGGKPVPAESYGID